MNKDELHLRRKILREENRHYKSNVFEEIPKERWPKTLAILPDSVFRSKEFMVQFYLIDSKISRLTINRTEIDNLGNWKDGISWDELNQIKRGCGFGDRDAVEAFPADKDIVNVANMRHLWIIPSSIADFFWRSK